MNAQEKGVTARKKPRFPLRVRLALLVGAIILFSLFFSLGTISLLDWLFPHLINIHMFWQILTISILVGIISAYFLSKLFFDPIKQLSDVMHRVSEGDFSVRMEEKSSSVEMRELFRDFNMMVKELSSTEIIQSDFIANVSHEFKTPINAIEGYTTLLQGADNIDETEREYIEKILFNTRRLSALVSNVLLLSKLENQQIQPKQAAYNVAEQIRECIVAQETSWSQKNLELDVELGDLEYTGNEGMMYYVWSNLLGNAIKFSPEGGLITLRLYREGDWSIFTVEDEGPGISEDAAKHLFDKFYQGDSSHKTEGNGLGLTLVRRILLLSN